ncbi:hypothetical protein L596_004648 [Steinernema carpocapsae]|uniref:HAP1 N-terminal domain-containing protein n=1 Tax=Steinernema carpocapsae TaxID=34508 RepID=A0A4U8UWK2_STECR|nr:hypothetical protein L596_004648 [Steinernema carpocapsae]
MIRHPVLAPRPCWQNSCDGILEDILLVRWVNYRGGPMINEAAAKQQKMREARALNYKTPFRLSSLSIVSVVCRWGQEYAIIYVMLPKNSYLVCLIEKEKDLELAAQIGKSLLESNRELQDRNDFLEESLIKSNEKTAQLQHQLKQRINLLHSISDDYDDGADLSDAARQAFRTLFQALFLTSQRTKRKSQSPETQSTPSGRKQRLAQSRSRPFQEPEWRSRRQIKEALGGIFPAVGFRQRQDLPASIRNCHEKRRMRCSERRSRAAHQRYQSTPQSRKGPERGESGPSHAADRSAGKARTAGGDGGELPGERYTEVMGMLQDAEEELSNFRQRGNFYMSIELQAQIRSTTPLPANSKPPTAASTTLR